jgi:hypothetical protein
LEKKWKFFLKNYYNYNSQYIKYIQIMNFSYP